jgi:hypothetical protein
MRITQFWAENLKGINHLGDNRCRWEDDTKMDLRITGYPEC